MVLYPGDYCTKGDHGYCDPCKIFYHFPFVVLDVGEYFCGGVFFHDVVKQDQLLRLYREVSQAFVLLLLCRLNGSPVASSLWPCCKLFTQKEGLLNLG